MYQDPLLRHCNTKMIDFIGWSLVRHNSARHVCIKYFVSLDSEYSFAALYRIVLIVVVTITYETAKQEAQTSCPQVLEYHYSRLIGHMPG